MHGHQTLIATKLDIPFIELKYFQPGTVRKQRHVKCDQGTLFEKETHHYYDIMTFCK